MNIAYLKFNNQTGKEEVHININAIPTSISFTAVIEPGDIEFAFGLGDGKEIVALLEQALALYQLESAARMHRFSNRDGGAEATFFVCARDRAIEITVERSDEGRESFSLSAKDAGILLDALRRALLVAAEPPEKQP